MKPVTFQTETWDEFSRDARALFLEHYDEAGAIDELPFNLNMDVGAFLHKQGNLRITTARAGRLMVGYVLFQTEPSLESRDVLVGVQRAPFVSKPFRGNIGTKMLKWAINDMKTQGVVRVILRSGVRGSGPRLSSLYTRMGAKEDARLFSMAIGD
jgi:hypothetical protein